MRDKRESTDAAPEPPVQAVGKTEQGGVLQESIDFTWDSDGMMVLTEDYLKRRGSCCKRGCRRCPYGFNQKDLEIPKK